MAERCAVLELGAAHPRVVGFVRGVELRPIENGQAVERRRERQREVLLVVERRAEVLYRCPNRVFPSGVRIGVKVFIYWRVRLFNLRVRDRREVHVDALGDVPADGEIAVPEELRRERYGQLVVVGGLHVALLQLVVSAVDVRRERDVLRQPVERELFEHVHPFRFRLALFPRLERFIHRRPRVVEHPLPREFFLVDGRLARGVGVLPRERQGEVVRVDRRGVLFVHYAHVDAGEREVRRARVRDGDVLYRVALGLAAGGFEGVVEEHVGVHRVVFRLRPLVRHRVVERDGDVRLVGEKLAQLELRRNGISRLVVLRARGNAVLDAAEALTDITPLRVDRAEVRQLHVEVALRGPTAGVVVVHHAELVHPHLAALRVAAAVAHADNHHFHFAQARVAHHRHAVLRIVVVVNRKFRAVRSQPLRLGLVALFFQRSEYARLNVNHIFFGPNGFATGGGILVIMAFRRERQRHFVFVIIALVIRAEPQEKRELVVFEAGRVGVEGVGVNEHLQALVKTEVERRVLINAFRFARRQIRQRHGQCLLVAFHKLRLRRVGVAAYARRQGVVHRRLVVVFLNIHCRNVERARAGNAFERLVVHAPLAAHKVEAAEAQHDRLLEICHKHPHEAYRREIADAARLRIPIVNGDAELVPRRRFGVAVAQLHRRFALVDDVISADNHIFGADGNDVLVIIFVLVQSVILIDILGIRRGFVRSVVGLGARVGVGRVALRIVDVLVAAQNRGLHRVVVRAAEIMIIVAGGVVVNAVPHGRADLALNLRQEVLIRIERPLLLVGEAVQADILQLSRAR